MKKIVLVMMALTIAFGAFAQEAKSSENEISKEDKLRAIETDEGEVVDLGMSDYFNTQNASDTTILEIGDKELLISDLDGNTKVLIIDLKTGEKQADFTEKEFGEVMAGIDDSDFSEDQKRRIMDAVSKQAEVTSGDEWISEEDMAQLEEDMDELERDMEEMEEDFEDYDSDWWDFDYDNDKKKKDKFEGHWASFEVGVNNFVNSDYSMNYDPEWMNLNTTKSWNVNLNVAQQSINLIRNRVGLVTGVGFEWNGYNFDGKNSITKVDGLIVPDSSLADFTHKKNKLRTIYLTVPALLEIQFSKNEDFYLAVGGIGGVKLGSSTKVVYYDENNDKQKEKRKGDDLNIRSLRYGLMAKVGFDVVDIYARYYLTSLFDNSDDPELYPFSLGLAVNF
jgi:hypothetical protein